MNKRILITGAIFSLLTVIIGAFGSHAFNSILHSNNRLDTFETAVRYQMFHALSLTIIGLLSIKKPNRMLNYSAILFFFGIIIFSGSLYLLSLLNISIFGMITPIGGICFIIGWVILIIHLIKSDY